MLFLAGILFWQTQHLVSVLRWTEQTDQMIAQANYTEKLLVDMETGLRGYLVTGNSDFLEPYQRASVSINPAFERLRSLIEIEPIPPQQQQIAQLQSEYQQWYRYSQQLIALRKGNGNWQADAINFEGKSRMDRMRNSITSLRQTEENLRQTRTQLAEQTTWLLLGNLIGLTFGIGSILAAFIRRQLLAVSNSYKYALESYQAQTQALRESEESFRLLVEGVQDYAIFMIDPNGYCISWNPGAERIKGYKREEIIGQHFSRFYTAADIEAGKPELELQVAGATGRYEDEGWRVRKDGSLFWANVVVTALRDQADNLRGFAKVTRDITERKRTQEALQASEQRFRATFEQAAVGIAHVSSTGQWLLVNQKLCDLVGYTREELLEGTFQKITYPEDLDVDLNYVNRVLAGELNTYSLEKRYIRKAGSLIWINLTVSLVRDAGGEPNYFIAVIEDISDRKQAEATLYRSNQRLAALQEIDRAILAAQSLEELVRAALSRMGRSLPCQQSLVVLFDLEKNEAQVIAEKLTADWAFLANAQVPIQEFIPTEAFHRDTPLLAPFSYFLDYPPILKRHGVAEMGSYLNVPLVANGEMLGELILATAEQSAFDTEALEIINEVANQIAIAIHQGYLREQLQRRADELEQRVAERTAELESFAYSVSHDLRAPLRTMQGFSQALVEDYADDLDALGKEYANRISIAAQRMETLIQDLLTYSRLSRAEIQLLPIDLASLLKEVLDQLEPQFQEQKVQVTVETSLLQVEMLGHRTTLVQVITNLLMNAAKFISPGVQPEIRIWAEWRREGMDETEKWIRLWIADNGIGIAPEHQERIFRVFERLHGIETYPGTGIGLAIVRKGMERMGGRFGVESVVGQGSQFWIELPQVEKSVDDGQ